MRGATSPLRCPSAAPGFQSTLPMRGATGNLEHRIYFYRYFNPRAPCGERQMFKKYAKPLTDISIHAPHAGSDCVEALRKALEAISIHAPHAGSDDVSKAMTLALEISIHAPHAGSDQFFLLRRHQGHDFNPRSPCGERRHQRGIRENLCDFNPRSPCGERP